jgi:hypothetical protein
MRNASDEPEELPVISIEQADRNESAQIIFRAAVKKGSLSTASSQGSLYLEWSIITDPTDIDGPENDDDSGGENKDSESESESSNDEKGDEENTLDSDSIDNIK